MQSSLLCKPTDSAASIFLGRAMVLLLVAVALAPATLFAGNAKITATLDRDTVNVGDAAVLTFTVEGGTPKLQPAVPNVPGLRTQFGGQNSQFQWINGETKSTVSYTYQLAPTQPGEYKIPPIEANIGGEVVRTPQLILKAVRAEAAAPDSPDAENQLALVKLVVPNRPIYVGEVVPVELQLYVHDGVLNINGFQSSPLNAEGFTFGKSIQAQRRVVQIGNTKFLLIPFITAATAVKTGTLNLNPVDCTMVLELPGQQRQRDAFDPFGMFNRNEQRRITLSTESATLNVESLPEGAPEGFNGAVGSYTLNMTATPNTVTAGDPVTVKVKFAGRGSLDTLTLPPQAEWSDFKVYPPTSKLETTDQLGLQGHKEFELVVVPQTPEIRELPPLTFSFFDPENRQYRTLKPQPIKLTVRPNNNASNNSAFAANPQTAKPEPVTRDIVPIKQRLGATSSGKPLLSRPGFWIAQSVPLAAWLTLLVRRKQADALANNPRLRRQRAVTAVIASGLDELKELAADKDSDNFFATLFRLLQEQIGERLDMPAASITESVIEDRLRPHGVAGPTLERLQELFHACNQARYAPVKSSHELEAYIPRLESMLRELQTISA